jgi:hypothetical protein
VPPKAVAPLILFAAALGIAGDALLRGGAPGLGVAILAAVFTGAVALVTKRLGRTSGIDELWLWLVAPFFGACLAWRDSPMLRVLDAFALLTGLGLLALRSRGVSLVTGSLTQYAKGLASSAAHALVGAAPLALVDLPRADLPWRRFTAPARAAAIGVCLAAAPVLVFGRLFASADPVFESMVSALFGWDLGSLIPHAVTAGVIAWLSAGYLRDQLVPDERPNRNALAAPRLGIAEVGIPLGGTIAVFALFLAIQARYLFGGAELVLHTTGLTFAEYARRGFFELVAASGLAVPLLLLAGWAFAPATPKHRAVFRALVTLQIALVGAVMVSALQRMLLYVDAYGLSQIRVFATAFMLWIAGTLAWMGIATLRGRPERFMYAAAIRGFALVALLNVVNVDAMIARTNLARAAAGRPLDIAYLSDLSTDAAPTVAAALGALDPALACPLWRSLRHQTERHPSDWRAWNWSRWRAQRAMYGTSAAADDACTPVT